MSSTFHGSSPANIVFFVNTNRIEKSLTSESVKADKKP